MIIGRRLQRTLRAVVGCAIAAACALSTPAHAQDSGDVTGGLLTGLGDLLGQVALTTLIPTPGTASYNAYLTHNGHVRRTLVIRPVTTTVGAPVLVLLHPRDETPEQIANIADVGRLAAEAGVWVLVPEGVGRTWNDRHALDFVDDVGFLSALLDAVLPIHALDARRVYLAGFSNGGYMAERYACDRAERVAGIATVGAPLRDSVGARCALSLPMPVVQFHGTEDLVVPYPTLLLRSGAVDGARYWAERAGCAPGSAVETVLPNRESPDQTRVRLSRHGACTTGVETRLYTIEGGGHTWPGSPHALYLALLGRTTGDVDATLELWRVLSAYRR